MPTETKGTTEANEASALPGQRTDRAGNERRDCELAAEFVRWDLKDTALIILAVLACFYTLYFTRALLFPIVLAFIINLVLKPVILRLERWHLPSSLSAALVMILGTGIVVGGVWLLWDPASRWIAEARLRLPAATRKIKDLQRPIEQIAEVSEKVEEITAVESQTKAVQVENKEDKLGSALNITGSFLGSTMIVVVLLFFLLAGGDRFLEKTVALMPTWREKRKVVELSRDIQSQISSYLFSITAINATLGFFIGLGLYAVGIPEPALWGTLAALLNYIPFAGALVGATIVLLVGLISLPTVGAALLAPLVYLTANVVESNFITPAVLGKSISLNPVILVLSIFFWGWLWGVGGVLLAVPLLVVLKIWFDHSQTLQPMGVFLGR